MSTDRFDQLHDEYLEAQDEALKAWIAWNVDELTRACLAPQVDEILEAWDNGSDMQPWQDAKSSSEEADDVRQRPARRPADS
jgi:hypothetical protein